MYQVENFLPAPLKTSFSKEVRNPFIAINHLFQKDEKAVTTDPSFRDTDWQTCIDLQETFKTMVQNRFLKNSSYKTLFTQFQQIQTIAGSILIPEMSSENEEHGKKEWLVELENQFFSSFCETQRILKKQQDRKLKEYGYHLAQAFSKIHPFLSVKEVDSNQKLSPTNFTASLLENKIDFSPPSKVNKAAFEKELFSALTSLQFHFQTKLQEIKENPKAHNFLQKHLWSTTVTFIDKGKLGKLALTVIKFLVAAICFCIASFYFRSLCLPYGNDSSRFTAGLTVGLGVGLTLKGIHEIVTNFLAANTQKKFFLRLLEPLSLQEEK